jgi:tetratricopeptide (TPR) repeat protein
LFRARYRTTESSEWLDRAIEAGRAILVASVAPLDISLAYNNLSTALRDRYLARGDAVDIDAGIEAARIAVGALPTGHVQRPMALDNLANNLRVRAARTRNADDLKAAIAAFKEAIATAPEGSEVWRTGYLNLGQLLDDIGDYDHAAEALEVGFTRTVQRAVDIEIVEGSRVLAMAYVRRENWSRAGEVLVAGIDALDRVQRTQFLTDSKKHWLTKFGDLHILAAEALLHSGNVNTAIEMIERGRGRLLGEVLDLDRAALTGIEQTGDQALVSDYRGATERIRLLTGAAERGQDVRDALTAAKQLLDAITNEVREKTSDAAFSRPMTIEEIAAASGKANSPLVYLVPLSGVGVAFIVYGRTNTVRTIMLPELTIESANAAVERYIAAYRGFAESGKSSPWQQWKAVLDETVCWCWRACMRHVASEIGETREAILIPAGRLGRLPLHAAGGSEVIPFDTTTWRYAPNARSLLQLGPINPDSLLAVVCDGNGPPLPHTALEIQVARRAFSNEQTLEGDAATIAAVLDKARHATVLHFACHATAAGYDATAGGVQLADGVLSLQELFDRRLAKGTIAILSACETGIIGERLPDEVLSTASGMLQAGASAVISSLWAVPDISTAILMSRFYFLWRNEGKPPAIALRDAQRWIRVSNNGAIASFLRDKVTVELVEGVADALERDPSGSIFSYFVHWAAFTYAGC